MSVVERAVWRYRTRTDYRIVPQGRATLAADLVTEASVSVLVGWADWRVGARRVGRLAGRRSSGGPTGVSAQPWNGTRRR